MPVRRRQLDLFAAAEPALPPVPSEADVALGARLPRGLHLGTSSWSFPGWAGLVYGRARSETELARDGLAEYARHPLLGTVCIDRGYYAPIPAADLARYAVQLPAGFPCVVKVWDGITSRVFPRHPRWGARAGGRNPDYLQPAVFAEQVLAPLAEAFLPHLAALLLEVPPTAPEDRPEPGRFADELAAFFAAVPAGFPYAVELRDRTLLTPAYLSALREAGVVHVINYWSWMPTPREQLRVPGILTGGFALARLMLRPGTRYEERKRQMAPFDRVLDPDEDLRDSVVELWEAARERELDLFVTINNKAEGSAPLTARAIAERVVAREERRR